MKLLSQVYLALNILGAFGVNGDTSDDPTYTDMTDLLDDGGNKVATLYYRLDALDASQLPSEAVSDADGTNAISIKMVYDGQAWLSLGTSRKGKMKHSEVVIGIPGDTLETPNPAKYGPITGKSRDDVISSRLDASEQTLIYGSIDQSDNQTVLTFTKALAEVDETPIDSSGDNLMTFAIGRDNSFPGFHSGGFGVFSLDLSSVSRPTSILTAQSTDLETNMTAMEDYNNTLPVEISTARSVNITSTLGNMTYVGDYNSTAIISNSTYLADFNETVDEEEEAIDSVSTVSEVTSAAEEKTANSEGVGSNMNIVRALTICVCSWLAIAVL